VNVRFRPARPDDEALIYSSWLRSLWHDAGKRPTDARYVRKSVWHRGQHRLVERLMGSGAEVLCAELEGLVIGWICFDPGEAGTLHYGYVKDAYRGRGVFKALLREASVPLDPLMVSQLTGPVLAWRRAGKPVEFDPFAAVMP
jgi:hypothetical protein